MQKLSLTGEPEEKRGGYSWKILIFGILGVLLSFSSGFLFAKIFQGSHILGLSAGWWLLISAFLLVPNFILESVFANSNRWLFLILQAIALGSGFYLAGDLGQFWRIVLAIVPLAFSFAGRQSIRRNEEDMMKIHWHRMVGRGTNFFITGLALFAALSFGISLLARPAGEFAVSKNVMEKYLNNSGFIPKLIGLDFDWEMKFGDFSKEMAVKTTGSVVDGAAARALSILPFDLSGVLGIKTAEIVDSTAAEFSRQAEDFLNMDISSDEKLSDIAYRWLADKFNSLSSLSRTGLVAAAAFILFLILKAAAPLFAWVARMIAWLIYQFLLAVKFAAIGYENRSKEAIILT